MAQQRVTFKNKDVERAINAMFKELYDRTTSILDKATFKDQYTAAATTAAKLDVVATYLGLK